MNGKKWIKIFSLLVLSTITSVYLINYIVDNYSIFKEDYSKLYREPNQNYIKMNFLLNDKHDFDSFIFGSSRVGKINPKNITNGKYYNMSYSEGLPLEHLENIKLLINSGIKIKNILIGFDDFSYEVDPSKHLTQPMRLPHYNTKINNMDVIQFYNYYLAKKPSVSDILKTIKQIVSKDYSKTSNFDIYNTGVPIVPQEIEDYIENNRDKHINDVKFLKPTYYRGNRIIKTLLEIEEIITLLKTHNIEYVLFINPIHKTTYLDTNFDNLQTFKYELSKLTEFYDFSGLNSITTNNYYFYETSHYRTIIGDLIPYRLFNTSNKVPEDFGVLVTPDNIDEHLKNLKNEIENYDLKKTFK